MFISIIVNFNKTGNVIQRFFFGDNCSLICVKRTDVICKIFFWREGYQFKPTS